MIPGVTNGITNDPAPSAVPRHGIPGLITGPASRQPRRISGRGSAGVEANSLAALPESGSEDRTGRRHPPPGLLLILPLALLLSSCATAPQRDCSRQNGAAWTDATPAALPPPRTYLLAVARAKPDDPQPQQQRAITAVQRIADAAKTYQPDIEIEVLCAPPMTREDPRSGVRQAEVTVDAVCEHLRRLGETVTDRDTVILYTHTHGIPPRSVERNRHGGMLLDPAPRLHPASGLLSWERYADLILEIPAKTVVVLTMSCFSGGLVAYLDAPQTRERWQHRQEKQGRNLLVITSQCGEQMSPPIVKNRELINPFTYAVAAALAGQADGFHATGVGSASQPAADGKLSLGECAAFVLHTTRNTNSEWAGRPNNAEPQLTGSFNPEDILLCRPDTVPLPPAASTSQQVDR